MVCACKAKHKPACLSITRHALACVRSSSMNCDNTAVLSDTRLEPSKRSTLPAGREEGRGTEEREKHGKGEAKRNERNGQIRGSMTDANQTRGTRQPAQHWAAAITT